MKKLLILLFVNVIAINFAFSQGVSINITNANADTSAGLDVYFTNKGVLIPRIALLSNTDLVTILSPAKGLLVYNPATGGLAPAGYYYNSGTPLAPVWIRFITTDSCSKAISAAQYPTFDADSPYLLLGALWVGYDSTACCWKYNKQASGRGLSDPGNPNTWTVNGTTINYFNGNLDKLPSGTHINNLYNPETMAAVYLQNDIMVKTGSFWTDKYESRIILVTTGTWQDNDVNTIMTPADDDIRGSGYGIPPTWMAFSQKDRGSTGMSWFVAQQAALNTGKQLMTNAEWQGAAAGTARTDGTGMTVNGETWATVADQDISRFGVVGMAGSLWELVSDWGQYGRDMGIIRGATSTQQGSYNLDMTWNINGECYTNNASVNGGPGGWITGLPAAVHRGGSWVDGTNSGIFAYHTNDAPSAWSWSVGFRCVSK